MFEYGKVVHIVENAETDGYYRSGVSLCGLVLSEEDMAVEIYPAETLEEVAEASRELADSFGPVCLRCMKNPVTGSLGGYPG